MIRVMQLADLDRVLGWAAAEGWNPGLADASAFLAADPQGFFVAERDGQPVAAISVVNHDPQLAFLGLYLCQPAFRGQGIGFGLWAHAMAHAAGRTVGLDGVAAQQANYAKSGFLLNGATLRLQGRIPAFGPLSAPALRPAEPRDFAALAGLDRAANGYDRTAFLTGWTTASPSRHTLLAEQAGGITGFATGRMCQSGCKIGPIIGPDTNTAMALICALAARLGTDLVTVDIPAGNVALLAELSTMGFSETFRTARMYRGAAPVAGAHLQAIGTMELG